MERINKEISSSINPVKLQERENILQKEKQKVQPSPFKFAEELLSGLLLYWPHLTQPVSILLCGPSGNGKSYLVRKVVQKVNNNTDNNNNTHIRVISFIAPLAESLAHKNLDGSSALRKDIRRMIRNSVFESNGNSINSNNNNNNNSRVSVVVILDHMELFITASTDAAELTRNSRESSNQKNLNTPNNPVLLSDLYDIIRGRDLFTQEEFKEMKLNCILFLTLFAGNYEDIDPFARTKLFDNYISLKTPTEIERLEFLYNHTNIPPLLCRAVAARSGGIMYRGLMEIVNYVEEIMHQSDFEEIKSLLLNLNNVTPNSENLNYNKIESLVAVLSLRALRTFSTSGSTAAKEYRESAGFVDVQETRWDDIAGLKLVKKMLKQLVIRPLELYKTYRHFGVRPSTGVLLCGPPGTGKTMLAKAMATELNASFIYLDLPQLIQSEVGESERRLREFFEIARERSPSVMFIDELQAAFGVRNDNYGRSGSVHDARLVSQLLYLLDLAQEDEEHFTLFVGATNVKHMIDEALLRAGRLDTVIEVPLPDTVARQGLVQKVVYGEWANWFPRDTIINDTAQQTIVKAFVDFTIGFSGAQLRYVMNIFALQFVRIASISSGFKDEKNEINLFCKLLQNLMVNTETYGLSTNAQEALNRALLGVSRG